MLLDAKLHNQRILAHIT